MRSGKDNMRKVFNRYTTRSDHLALCQLIGELGGHFISHKWSTRCMFIIGTYFEIPASIPVDQLAALNLIDDGVL